MTCRVFVEGVDDIRFLQHLLKVFVPTLPDWKKPAPSRSGESKEFFVEMGGHTLVLTATRGWSKISDLGPYAQTFAHPHRQMGVDRTLILFDADAPQTNNGQPCADGGFQARLAALKTKTGGSLQSLLFSSIPTTAPMARLKRSWKGW